MLFTVATHNLPKLDFHKIPLNNLIFVERIGHKIKSPTEREIATAIKRAITRRGTFLLKGETILDGLGKVTVAERSAQKQQGVVAPAGRVLQRELATA